MEKYIQLLCKECSGEIILVVNEADTIFVSCKSCHQSWELSVSGLPFAAEWKLGSFSDTFVKLTDLKEDK